MTPTGDTGEKGERSQIITCADKSSHRPQRRLVQGLPARIDDCVAVDPYGSHTVLVVTRKTAPPARDGRAKAAQNYRFVELEVLAWVQCALG